MHKFRLFVKGFCSGVVIDDIFFKLHYRLTLMILLVLSIAVACRQYFGTAIICRSTDASIDYMNNYCYIHPTFSIVEAWDKEVGEEVPYPGITKDSPNKVRKYHSYYQWVATVLVLQAILFYVPRLIWKTLENGRIEELLEEFKHPKKKDNLESGELESVVDLTIENFNHNKMYFVSFVLAEILNFWNVIAQMVLLGSFLGENFMSYGLQVLQSGSEAMVRLFPKAAKCTLYTYGESGIVRKHSAMCLLPINVFNEKIYAFLWFWFVILAVLSALAVVFRLTLVFPPIRCWVMTHATRRIQYQDLSKVLKKRDVGDWFIIYLLSKNMSSVNFRKFLSVLAMKTVKTDGIELLKV